MPLDLKLTSATCAKCENPVLDEIGTISSFCNTCSYVWMSEFTHNPLAEYILLDYDLYTEFDTIFNRCGNMLVGNYSATVESDLFDLFLFAEPGMYM